MASGTIKSEGIYIGPWMGINVSWNAIGWTEANNIHNPCTIPTKAGYTFIGFIGLASQTYRVIAPYYTGGNIYFYAVSTDVTSTVVGGYPVYVKN